MSATEFPLYLSGIVLPVLAFPAWILCLAPLTWHFHQGNIAAGSLILWCLMVNFFNSINALIWPRDNIADWWDGNIWCDINVRIQVGAVVGTTASAAMIVRKLARVMDTKTMTVNTSKSSKRREQYLEVAWCWGYPLVLIILYYIVQPVRYMIYSIQGCMFGYESSWPSVVLSYMWGPITILVASGYAFLLTYRLFRYRREFARLVAARNTTKARFIRLFIICIIIIVVYLPYTIYLLATLISSMRRNAPYSWNRVHNPADFNNILRVPMFGAVNVDRWGEIATGYVLFFVFGTGADAWNSYRAMAVKCGLGRWFPRLLLSTGREGSGAQTPTSFATWRNSVTSRAKSVFVSRSESVATSIGGTTRNNSVVMADLRSTTTQDPILDHDSEAGTSTRSSVLSRIFRRQNAPVLPMFTRRSDFMSEGVDTNSRDWAVRDGVDDAALSPKSSSRSDGGSIRVLREVRFGSEDEEAVKERKSMDV